MEANGWKWLMGIGLASCWLVGCANLESGVPAVSRQMIEVSGGDTGERLEVGRRVLTTRCGACHRVYAPGAYRSAEWVGIVDEMAARSKLRASERESLLLYLVAAERVQKTGVGR